MKNILISVSISYLNHGINKQNGKKVIAVKDANCAFAKRNPEKVQAYQTLRTLAYKTLVQGSNPGKPDFSRLALSNTSKLTWTRKSMSHSITGAVIKTEPP